MLFTAFLAAGYLPAQEKTSLQQYKERYERLVSRGGVAGLGVETLLDHWAEDYPDDPDLYLARFSLCLEKSKSTSIDTMSVSKYLGNAPVLTLKDSSGRDVNYFQTINYDDEEFRKACDVVTSAIAAWPDRLDFRFFKISALMEYEKESPDMAMAEIRKLTDYNYTSHPQWEYPGIEVTPDTFAESIQEYCYAFFRIGSQESYEAFKTLSEKMLSYRPDDPVFLNNLGSYQLVVAHNDKAALKIYNKVLKKHPDDYSTIKNCVLLARNAKNAKLEKKYLPMLIRVTGDEAEKASCQARLNAL